MKRSVFILILVLAGSTVWAESVWTGNAGAGNTVDFPGASEVYRAASNTFPSGTVLKVTNPRDGSSVEVMVVSRLESPGVFLLIEKSAASVIGLPLDHVLPVRVTPLTPDGERITSRSDEVIEAKSVMSENQDTEGSAGPAGDAPDSSEGETIITYDITAASGTGGETAPETGEEIEESAKVFFLMPADLRPPEVSDTPAALTELPAPAPESAPEPLGPSASGFAVNQVIPGDTRDYVQIGSYRNRSVMEEAARWIMTNAPGYPVSMAVGVSGGAEIYRLLIGPLQPAERAVVLRTARQTVFPDAFPYKQ